MIRRLLVSKRLKQVRLLVCDVDGVLTDGGLHYDESRYCVLATFSIGLE